MKEEQPSSKGMHLMRSTPSHNALKRTAPGKTEHRLARCSADHQVEKQERQALLRCPSRVEAEDARGPASAYRARGRVQDAMTLPTVFDEAKRPRASASG